MATPNLPVPIVFLDDTGKPRVLALTQGSQAHSLAFPMEGVVIEKRLRSIAGAAELLVERTHLGHGVLQLYDPLHNFEMPASLSQQSRDALSS